MSNGGIWGAIVAGAAAQEKLMNRLNGPMICKYCGREITRSPFHSYHYGDWYHLNRKKKCYPKKKWRNYYATPSTEADLARRILNSYEV
jgi:hypothetical protein